MRNIYYIIITYISIYIPHSCVVISYGSVVLQGYIHYDATCYGIFYILIRKYEYNIDGMWMSHM